MYASIYTHAYTYIYIHIYTNLENKGGKTSDFVPIAQSCVPPLPLPGR